MTLLEAIAPWADAPEPSIIEFLFVTLIGPIFASVVISILVLGPRFFKKEIPSTEVVRTGDN